MSQIIRSHWKEARVRRLYRWRDGLFTLHLDVELLPFKAGQFVRLRLPLELNGEIKPIARSYSLVNVPGEPGAEILFNAVPGGRVSNALAALKEGDTLEVSQPAQGFFVLDEVPDCETLWMIASGTGLGPSLAMLKTEEIWQRFKKIVLVHSVSYHSQRAYGELIDSFSQAHPAQFRFVSCVTREPNPGGLSTRVTAALSSGELEAAAGEQIGPDNAHVMMCGNRHMLEDMKTLLAERGMRRHLRRKPGHITTEEYF
ncbi:ferredoxin--NADP reductase [Granulosicoccaceae sp. 1_MG-2023]|nr:ferredoxin--NADP reductase [Granulosicoccaceae sp. 1_MG-2023]